MEILFILLGLIFLGVLLAVGFSAFISFCSVIGTAFLTILSFLANAIGLSIVIILISLYALLPLDIFIITVLILSTVFGIVCWYYSDNKSINN